MYRRFCPYNTFVVRSPTFSFVLMCPVRDSPIATDSQTVWYQIELLLFFSIDSGL